MITATAIVYIPAAGGVTNLGLCTACGILITKLFGSFVVKFLSNEL